MAKRYVMLTYGADVVSEPIIYSLGKDFNLKTNIRKAKISSDRGWALLELDGSDRDIEAGLTWVTGRGVRVETVDEGFTGGR